MQHSTLSRVVIAAGVALIGGPLIAGAASALISVIDASVIGFWGVVSGALAAFVLFGVSLVVAGEHLTLTRSGEPVAELRPLPRRTVPAATLLRRCCGAGSPPSMRSASVRISTASSSRACERRAGRPGAAGH